MKPSESASNSVKRVWWLTLIAVLWASTAIYFVSSAMLEVIRQREQHDSIQQDLHAIDTECFQLIDAANETFIGLLEENIIPDEVPAWLAVCQSARDRDYRLSKDAALHSKTAALANSEKDLLKIYEQSRRWAFEAANSRVSLLEADERFQTAIDALHELVELAGGEAELGMAIILRNSAKRKSIKDAMKLINESAEWDSLRKEIGDLRQVALRLQSVNNLNSLDDLKDNQTAAPLRRLRSVLETTETRGQTEETMLEALQDVEVALLGCTFQWDAGKQTLRLRDGGLFAEVKRGLVLKAVNRNLQVEVARLLASIRSAVAELRLKSFEVARRQEQEISGTVANAWNRVLITTVLGLSLLIIASITIPRVFTRQIQKLETAYDEIAAKERMLAESQERYDLAIKGSSAGIWDWNLATEEMFYSPRFLEMLGYTEHEPSQGLNSFFDMVHTDDIERVKKAFDSHFSHAHVPFDIECRLQTSSGQYRYFHSRGEMIRGTDGSPHRMAGSLTDISERKSAEQRLEQAMQELTETHLRLEKQTIALQVQNANLKKAQQKAEAANQSKSHFLANMSHEIRTPMNGIIGLTQMAWEATSAPEQKEQLNTVISSAEALLQIINDILDLSKMEAGKLPLDPHPFCLRKSVSEAIAPLLHRAEQKHLKLTTQVCPQIPDNLIGDAGRIKQVLINLVGNAIKFTDKGFVHLEASVESRTELSVAIRFCVTDTGIGIDEKHHSIIFEPFCQSDGSTTRSFGGTGLGLAISRDFVRSMGGDIALESSVGKGSSFSFTVELPIAGATANEIYRSQRSAAPDTRKPETEAAKTTARPQTALRVLLAEDNAVNQTVIRHQVLKLGHTIKVVANCKLALEALQNEQFDLVLMYVQMPVLDGLGAVGQLRKQESQTGRHMPVIAITANAMVGDRDKCLDAGMDDYISKPIHAPDLQKAINRVAQTSTAHITATPPSTIQHDSAHADRRQLDANHTACCDLTLALEKLDGDEDILRELAQIFVSTIPQQAIDLRQAVESQLLQEARELAHSIKGSVRYFAADRAYQAAHQLELQSQSDDYTTINRTCQTLLHELLQLKTALQTQLDLALDGVHIAVAEA